MFRGVVCDFVNGGLLGAERSSFVVSKAVFRMLKGALSQWLLLRLVQTLLNYSCVDSLYLIFT